MKKPAQFKNLHRDADNAFLLDELETAMFSISEAMTALAGYEDFADWFDTLSDMWDEMEPKLEEYESIAADEQRKEEEGLTRQYWRSVL